MTNGGVRPRVWLGLLRVKLDWEGALQEQLGMGVFVRIVFRELHDFEPAQYSNVEPWAHRLGHPCIMWSHAKP